eukprot:4140172-Amphidinium_carterae.1
MPGPLGRAGWTTRSGQGTIPPAVQKPGRWRVRPARPSPRESGCSLRSVLRVCARGGRPIPVGHATYAGVFPGYNPWRPPSHFGQDGGPGPPGPPHGGGRRPGGGGAPPRLLL